MITPERDRQIQRLLDDEWESESEFDEFFAGVQSSGELHMFADGWNWDGGVEELRRVIRHPLCELATALLIYWRGQPVYYLKYHSVEDAPEHERPGFNLLREIESKVRGCRFRYGALTYKPTDDQGHDMTRGANQATAERTIPSEMYSVGPTE